MAGYPVTLTITTGRAGSSFLAALFHHNFGAEGAWVSHEWLKKAAAETEQGFRCELAESRRLLEKRPVAEFLDAARRVSESAPFVDFGWPLRTLIPAFAESFGARFRVLHLHRHPVSVAGSKAVSGSFSQRRNPGWCPQRSHPRLLFPTYRERWPRLNPFEKCLHGWLEVNASALEYRERNPQVAFLSVSADALFGSDELRCQLAGFLGFDCRPGHVDLPPCGKNEAQRWNLEHRPLGQDWRRYSEHPEVLALAGRLGYAMAESDVARLAAKYQRPPGLLPWLRHRSGYWGLRKWLHGRLRGGSRAKAPAQGQAGPPGSGD